MKLELKINSNVFFIIIDTHRVEGYYIYIGRRIHTRTFLVSISSQVVH